MADTAEAPEKTADELVGRLFGAGIGYAEAAGFREFDRLDEPELDALRLYRLTP